MFYRRYIFGPGPVEISLMMIFITVIYIMVITLWLLFIKLPLNIYDKEKNHYKRMQIINNISSLQINDLTITSKIGDTIKTISSGPINAFVTDPLTSVKINGAISLKRNIHYCNWVEKPHKKCIRLRKCRCKEYTTTYSYSLKWVTDQVSSNKFHEPQEHYNPSSVLKNNIFISNPIIFNTSEISKNVYLDNSLTQNIRSDEKHVIWSQVNSNLNYHSEKLSNLIINNKNFSYLPNLGIFYMPFDGKLKSEFWHSGSFQDYSHDYIIYMLQANFISCTPGDIVISYQAKIPKILTVLGEIKQMDSNNIYLTKLKGIKDNIDVQTVYGEKLTTLDIIYKETNYTYYYVFISRSLIMIIIICLIYKKYVLD